MTESSFATDIELAHRTTRTLAGTLEGTALLVQAIVLATNAAIGDVTPAGRVVLWCCCAVQCVFAAAAQFSSGPLTRGGAWAILWFGAVMAMPLIAAHVCAPYQYGSSPACVQLCTYPTAPTALFSFYPWIGREQLHLRPAAELAVLAVVILEPLLIIELLQGDQLTTANYQSVAVSGLWNIAAFVAGQAVGRLCRTAAREQVRLQTENFGRIVDYLHSDIEGTIVAMQRGPTERPIVIQLLQSLYDRVSVYRLEMRLAGGSAESVQVAPLLAETLQVFSTALEIRHSPRPDWLTVSRSSALAIQRALGDLLKNAAQHGASGVELGLTYDEHSVTLELTDDGPGFSPAVFDNPNTSLSRLRNDIRALSGELSYRSGASGGARLQLQLPRGSHAVR